MLYQDQSSVAYVPRENDIAFPVGHNEFLDLTGTNNNKKELQQQSTIKQTDLNSLEIDPNTKFIKHTVKHSDTIQGIALRYGTRAQEIKISNNLWNDTNLFGRKVILIPVTVEELQQYLTTGKMASKRQEVPKRVNPEQQKQQKPQKQQQVPQKKVHQVPQVSQHSRNNVKKEKTAPIKALKKEDQSRLREKVDDLFDL